MMSSEKASPEIIIIGGGHNGLTAATILAKAGKRVTVLEASGETCASMRLHEFAPGHYASPLGHIINRVHPDVASKLDLAAHGLKLDHPPATTTILSDIGNPLRLFGAYGEKVEGLSDQDAAGWQKLRKKLLTHASLLQPMLTRRPPIPGEVGFADLASLGKTGLALRRLGREEMRDFLRMMLSNVADVADEFLTDNRLKGLLAFDAVLGSHLGPRSPTSLLGLYYRLSGEFAKQASQLVAQGNILPGSFEAAALKAGVTIRTHAKVSDILVEDGRAIGVRLTDGEEIKAAKIISALHPQVTFQELVGPRHLDTGIIRKAKNIRSKGNAAKLHLALSSVPQFKGLQPADLRGRLIIAPSIDHVELAFNPAKYGEFSNHPVMEITLPSISDQNLAPDGACTLSAIVQFAPYELKAGWKTGRAAFIETCINLLETYAPGISASVTGFELLTPADIEHRFLMVGGHWHHGEMQPDQMLLSRPFHGAAGYQTPITNLFLASSGAHPGGGISGIPGMNAANALLKEAV